MVEIIRSFYIKYCLIGTKQLRDVMVLAESCEQAKQQLEEEYQQEGLKVTIVSCIEC
ncbi:MULTISPECIES: hypothetical protein [unclassified Moraxella]|uniref:hypothetical protein n=1 Tax=unclassified Moraxella TaxID=2685852 RepID=UPI003AF6804B